MRVIDADTLSELVKEPIEIFLSRLDLKCPPIIEIEPHWIPITERLPEVKQKVLVQYADGSMATKRCNDAGHLAWFYSNAVAWMPAPEEYKEGKK